MAKPEWLREVEREHDKLMAEHEYEQLVARGRDHVVHKSAEEDDVLHRVATRSEPAPPFSDAQHDVLAEVVAKLQDEIENLRKTVRANDVVALHAKIDALLALLGGQKEHGKSADKIIDLPSLRRRDAS